MTAPVSVANTGSSASIRANVARGSLAIASWSVTYGMTDEHTPTPRPASSSQHGRAQLVDPAHRGAAGARGAVRPRAVAPVSDLVPEDHVQHEERAVAEREREPERLPGQPDVGDRGDAGHGEREGRRVARGPRPQRGTEEL